MAMTADGLKAAIQEEMESLTSESSPDAAQSKMANAIINYIKENLEVKIPSGSLIETVSGGSGVAALGVANVDAVDCEVS